MEINENKGKIHAENTLMKSLFLSIFQNKTKSPFLVSDSTYISNLLEVLIECNENEKVIINQKNYY